LRALTLFNEGTLEVNDFLNVVVGQFHTIEQHGLVHFSGAGFNHGDFFVGTRDDQIKVAFLDLFVGRVDEQFAVDASDTNRSERPVEGTIRDHESRRGPHDGHDVGQVSGFRAEDRGNDLDLVPVIVRKHWANGTIGQAGRDRLQVAGFAFTLEEPTGNFAGGIRHFLIFDG
jgi:hypothetical protein